MDIKSERLEVTPIRQDGSKVQGPERSRDMDVPYTLEKYRFTLTFFIGGNYRRHFFGHFSANKRVVTEIWTVYSMIALAEVLQ